MNHTRVLLRQYLRHPFIGVIPNLISKIEPVVSSNSEYMRNRGRIVLFYCPHPGDDQQTIWHRTSFRLTLSQTTDRDSRNLFTHKYHSEYLLDMGTWEDRREILVSQEKERLKETEIWEGFK